MKRANFKNDCEKNLESRAATLDFILTFLQCCPVSTKGCRLYTDVSALQIFDVCTEMCRLYIDKAVSSKMFLLYRM